MAMTALSQFTKFETLVGTVTLTGTISGKPYEWTITVVAPGGIVTTDETTERTPQALWDEMRSAAYRSVMRRRFPDQREAAR